MIFREILYDIQYCISPRPWRGPQLALNEHGKASWLYLSSKFTSPYRNFARDWLKDGPGENRGLNSGWTTAHNTNNTQQVFLVPCFNYFNKLTVLDRRCRILPEVVLVRRWVTGVLGIWRGEGLEKGLGQGRSVYKQPETDPVTARRVPSK
jgi:hypothetical protein